MAPGRGRYTLRSARHYVAPGHRRKGGRRKRSAGGLFEYFYEAVVGETFLGRRRGYHVTRRRKG